MFLLCFSPLFLHDLLWDLIHGHLKKLEHAFLLPSLDLLVLVGPVSMAAVALASDLLPGHEQLVIGHNARVRVLTWRMEKWPTIILHRVEHIVELERIERARAICCEWVLLLSVEVQMMLVRWQERTAWSEGVAACLVGAHACWEWEIVSWAGSCHLGLQISRGAWIMSCLLRHPLLW